MFQINARPGQNYKDQNQVKEGRTCCWWEGLPLLPVVRAYPLVPHPPHYSPSPLQGRQTCPRGYLI